MFNLAPTTLDYTAIQKPFGYPAQCRHALTANLTTQASDHQPLLLVLA